MNKKKRDHTTEKHFFIHCETAALCNGFIEKGTLKKKDLRLLFFSLGET